MPSSCKREFYHNEDSMKTIFFFLFFLNLNKSKTKNFDPQRDCKFFFQIRPCMYILNKLQSSSTSGKLIYFNSTFDSTYILQ